jgi:hypothetical protein
LDERLTAYVGDMGVARIVAETSLSAGAFCLTHAAPEQVLGLRCTLATDVYSVGILLIELTTQVAVLKRGNWRLPNVPEECSEVSLFSWEPGCVCRSWRQLSSRSAVACAVHVTPYKICKGADDALRPAFSIPCAFAGGAGAD